MDEMELEAKVAVLLKQDKHSEAEGLLRNVHDEAIRNNLLDLAICALTELTRVYVLEDRLSDEERCHLEIEKLEESSFSLVSSSWFYLYHKQDFEAAIAKADEAIVRAKAEGDTSTIYTALSARGQALIKLRRSAQAEDVMAEMLAMASQPKKLVPGDELTLLELAYSEGIARGNVAAILKIVRPYYREQGFIDRGAKLAEKLGI
jgi:hypothetical protein